MVIVKDPSPYRGRCARVKRSVKAGSEGVVVIVEDPNPYIVRCAIVKEGIEVDN